MPLTTSASPSSPASPSALKAYFLAARPKTWIASISPICIGTVMAAHINWSLFILTLLFSFLIQVGTNFANDYFDFVNGADSYLRNGPKRATQEGWIDPPAMLRATFLVFSAALVIAIPLMIRARYLSLGTFWSFAAGLWSPIVALLCVAFGIFYTRGPKPLGYLGLGEIFVFIFFGPVAVCGTFFLQTGVLDSAIFVASLAPGLLACCILIANNLRDQKSDSNAGKKTLIVRFGRNFGSWEYTLPIVLASLIPLLLVFFYHAPAILSLTSLVCPVSVPYIKKAFQFRDPLELISLLQGSAFLLFLYTVLFCLTLLLGTSFA